jgi:hypothetical protein
MDWHKITLTKEQVEQGAHKRLYDEFFSIIPHPSYSNSWPKGVLYCEEEDKETGATTLYFSPGCGKLSGFGALMMRYSGSVCPKPTAIGSRNCNGDLDAL